VSRSVPLRAVPMGVRRADTMTASDTGLLPVQPGAVRKAIRTDDENTILSAGECELQAGVLGRGPVAGDRDCLHSC